MRTIKHITPESRIFCGSDCLRLLPNELKRVKCGRALIFCDPFIEKEGKLLEMVKEILGERFAGVFSGIAPGSPVNMVKEGAKEIEDSNADAVVVIGGGSSVVTARAAIILSAEKADPHDICTKRAEDGRLVSPKLLAPKIPMFVIPTTPITAMVKAGASIIDPDTDAQLAMFDPKTRGKAIFIVPEFVKTMPMKLLLSACMSTLAAAVDGLLSKDGDLISDALLIQSVRILVDKLKNKEKLTDVDVRCEIMLATVLCGMGSDHTGFGISVVLGHAVTAYNRINAGFVNGIILPHALSYNREAEEGMKKVATGMGISIDGEGFAQKICKDMETLLLQLDIPHRLKDMGMPHEKFNEIAQAAIDDWYLQYNPVPVGKDDVVNILEAAW